MNKREFLNKIDDQINKKRLLNYSFYQAWNNGELDLNTIQE